MVSESRLLGMREKIFLRMFMGWKKILLAKITMRRNHNDDDEFMKETVL